MSCRVAHMFFFSLRCKRGEIRRDTGIGKVGSGESMWLVLWVVVW